MKCTDSLPYPNRCTTHRCTTYRRTHIHCTNHAHSPTVSGSLRGICCTIRVKELWLAGRFRFSAANQSEISAGKSLPSRPKHLRVQLLSLKILPDLQRRCICSFLNSLSCPPPLPPLPFALSLPLIDSFELQQTPLLARVAPAATWCRGVLPPLQALGRGAAGVL